MVKLTISEIHFIKRQLIARAEWIKDNPDDVSIEETEEENINSLLKKLESIKLSLEVIDDKV